MAGPVVIMDSTVQTQEAQPETVDAAKFWLAFPPTSDKCQLLFRAANIRNLPVGVDYSVAADSDAASLLQQKAFATAAAAIDAAGSAAFEVIYSAAEKLGVDYSTLAEFLSEN